MTKLATYIQAYLSNEEGATAIEYGLIAAGIAVVIAGAVFAFGGELNTLFTNLSGSLQPPAAGG